MKHGSAWRKFQKEIPENGWLQRTLPPESVSIGEFSRESGLARL
jgi:hypothetical protein